MPQQEPNLDLVPAEDEKPSPGWITETKIIRVVDADTLEVEVTRRFMVRLTHPTKKGYIFDTPEKNTELGKKAISWLEDKLKHFHGVITLFIDAAENESLMDFNSFSRILGALWLDKSRLTSTIMESGYGRLVKRAKRTSTSWEKNDGNSKSGSEAGR